MSVLVSMAMFPTHKGESKSQEVSQVIKVIKNSGFNYKLTAMSTIIETNTMSEALQIVEKCYARLEELGCTRVYSTMTFDIRKGYENRLEDKVKSVENKIGEVSK